MPYLFSKNIGLKLQTCYCKCVLYWSIMNFICGKIRWTMVGGYYSSKNRNKDEKDTKEELLYEEFAPKLRMGPQFEGPTISRETGAKPYIDHWILGFPILRHPHLVSAFFCSLLPCLPYLATFHPSFLFLFLGFVCSLQIKILVPVQVIPHLVSCFFLMGYRPGLAWTCCGSVDDPRLRAMCVKWGNEGWYLSGVLTKKKTMHWLGQGEISLLQRHMATSSIRPTQLLAYYINVDAEDGRPGLFLSLGQRMGY